MSLPACLQRVGVIISVFMIYIASHAWQYYTTLFRLLSSSQTGVQFANILTEGDTLNILNQANVYNGDGVGIGDFNKDGQ